MSKTDRRIEKGLVINEETDNSKKVRVTVSSGATTNTQTTLQSGQTADRTITLPDATDTLVGKNTTDILTNKTIDGDNNTVQDLALTSLKTNLTDASKFIVRDASGIPVSNTKAVPTGDVVGTSDSQTLTNKTIAGGSNTISGLVHGTQVDNPSSGVHGVTGSVVGTTDTQSLSNKTLSTPTVTGSLEADAVTNADIGTSGSATTVNIGTGSGANTINIGGASSTINMTGSVNNQNVTNLNVTDKLITLNDGGAASSGGGSGIEIEEGGSPTGYVQTSGDRNSWTFKAPNSAGVTSLTPGASSDVVTLNAASQTLTNKTIDGDDNTVQDLALTSLKTVVGDANKFLVRNGSGVTVSNTKSVPSGDVVGTSDSQTLTNKTLTTPNIDIAILDGQASTPSNPSSGFYKAYIKDSTQKLTILDSAGVETTVGSGSGTFNYITANDGTTIGDWITYDDGASASPVNGVDGSPGVTFTTSTNSGMRGANNFLFTHDAADRLGEGFSYLMAIDPSDRGKVLRLTFDYLIASGTFADNGMSIWFYDVTNSALIQPAPYLLKNSSLIERFSSEVQIPSSCASLRVIFHVTTTTATAYTIRFDDFNFSNQAKLYGSPITDRQSYSVSVLGSGGNPTKATSPTVDSGTYWRSGDTGHFHYDYAQTATTGAANGTGVYLFSLPSGLTIDSTKLGVTSSNGNYVVGTAGVLSGSASFIGIVYVYNSTSVSIKIVNPSDASGVTVDVGAVSGTGFTNAATTRYTLDFSVPILGWSSSVVMSSDADTRVVAAKYGGTPATSMTSGTEYALDFQTKDFDTHNAWTSTGSHNSTIASGSKFTVPVGGIYRVTAHVLLDEVSGAFNGSSEYWDLNLWKNGTNVSIIKSSRPPAGQYPVNSGSVLVNTNAGDTLQVTSLQASGSSLTTFNNPGLTWVSFDRLSGPSQIAASETVAARYTTAAGQSINNASWTIINFGTKDFDYTGSVTTGASWKFTAPVSGLYEASGFILIDAGSGWAAGEEASIELYKNGSAFARMGGVYSQATHSTYIPIPITAAQLRLLSSDYIDIRMYQSSGAAVTLLANAVYNWVNIKRVGNY